ncbi:MAG: EAL domain-containing protein, partial [Pseudomonadota bacterium]
DNNADNEARFRDFADIAVDMFWETDADLRFTYLSDGYLAATGISPDSVIGKTRQELIAPMLDEKTRDEHFAVLEQRLPYDKLEYQWMGHDGREITMRSWGRPFYDESGGFLGYRGVARDVTDSRNARVALQDSEARFQAFAEVAADLFWETDAQLRFTYLSDRYEEVTGVAPESVLGITRQELVLNMLIEPLRTEHERVLNAREPYDNLEYEWHPRNGKRMVLVSSARPFYDSDGEFCGYRGVARDITDTRQARKMIYRATHDDLTGLLNRSEFHLQVQKALEDVRNTEAQHVFCYLDLDQFKMVNDTAGHAIGDQLLKKISAMVYSNLETRDLLGRLGGDEFGLLFYSQTPQQGLARAWQLIERINALEFRWEGRSFEVRVSIGLVNVDRDAPDFEHLLSQADVACYTAKDLGRNCVYVYKPEADGLDRRHSEIFRAAELKAVLERDGLYLVAQRIVSLKEGSSETSCYEILVRLQNDVGQEVLPAEFIPAAERYGLMDKVDSRVIDKAIELLEQNSSSGAMKLNINVSANSLVNDKLFTDTFDALQKKGIDPARVCFEITETTLIANLAKAAAMIDSMRRCGFRFAIDDFGSGFSSFAYIKQLPVDYLKIDGSLVRNIDVDPRDRSIVRAINEVSHELGIETVAECAESKKTVALLRELGVDWAQGYAIAREVPSSEII